MMQDVHRKQKPRISMAKNSIRQERESFHQQIGHKFKEAPSAFLHFEHGFV
jgi:hypothetical protein